MSRLRRWVRWQMVRLHEPNHYAADCTCRHCRRANAWMRDLDLMAVEHAHRDDDPTIHLAEDDH